jgi:hypothetical protein
MRVAWLVLIVGILAGGSTVASAEDSSQEIHFGTPGPWQTITFADDHVRATLTFRDAPDRDHNVGPGAEPPSISAGTLSMLVRGVHHRYDLSEILANRVARVELSADSEGACGADRALSRVGDYLVVQAILTGKGCKPIANFIELQTGEIAQPVAYDPRWLHRFDPTPEHLSGTYARVLRVEAVATTSVENYGVNNGRRQPWRFLIVHVADATFRDRVLQIDEDQINADGPIILSPGSRVLIAPITAFADFRLFGAGPEMSVVQPSLADEARHDASQTPTPHDDERAIRRGLWLDWSNDAANRGDFAGAVSALATTRTYEDSATYGPDETQMLTQCRRLLVRVNAGAITSKAASAMFFNGCVPSPKR